MEDNAQKSIDRLNLALQEHFDRDRANDYDTIGVLILSWKDADDDGYGTEARALKTFFKNVLRYPTTRYEIPSEDSFWALDEKINAFLKPLRKSRSLAIIHYGGHGDSNFIDYEGKRLPRLGVWAARAFEGPELNWSAIQPKLGNFNGHVLLLLDCCFAGQAARSSDRVIPSNVELLAACAMGVQTPPPGENSFTTKWIQEAERTIARKGSLVLSELHHALSKGDARLAQTPVHWGLQGRQISIRLDPFPASASTCVRSHSASLALQVLIRDTLDDELVDDLRDWLETHAPRKVSSVQVVNHLKNFIFSQETPPSRSRKHIEEMETESREEIHSTWEWFKVKLRSGVNSLAVDLSVDWSSGDIAEEVRLDQFLGDLELNIQTLQRVVERGVLALPSLQTKMSLLDAIDNPNLEGTGIVDALRIKLIACFPPERTQSLLQAQPSSFSRTVTKSSTAPIVEENHPGYGNILVEYKSYSGNSEASSASGCGGKMNRLAAVLQVSIVSTYHTPKCLGWFHDLATCRFGLMFAKPDFQQSDPISLRHVLDIHNGSVTVRRSIPKPSLEERFIIVRKMGEAILKWHTAGWVHQGITSHNIVFLQAGSGSSPQYRTPYLCGFGFSRRLHEESADQRFLQPDFKTYMHPQRQDSPPKFRHTERHDIYSFGLVLVEVALWDTIPNLFRKIIDRKGNAAIQNEVVKRTTGLIRHLMGDAYEQATLYCLMGQFSDIQDEVDVRLKLAKAFEHQVLRRLALPSATHLVTPGSSWGEPYQSSKHDE
ncbi:hypothetical protein K505DRAFT_294092 [Melanomma pulvis-pyrius CBS 109.77]|uniref:Protein kinase domain-containing protein n=1 Tax=Melanomma pulvis-pyrius CBS 109.77 TaxID=1314802 RepID=A0A6A6XTZ4_9PLEO|nr:hypothetical protein K505DRAFT_294092 [Melanomma pulvis-pyrius CBS 109.77]